MRQNIGANSDQFTALRISKRNVVWPCPQTHLAGEYSLLRHAVAAREFAPLAMAALRVRVAYRPCSIAVVSVMAAWALAVTLRALPQHPFNPQRMTTGLQSMRIDGEEQRHHEEPHHVPRDRHGFHASLRIQSHTEDTRAARYGIANVLPAGRVHWPDEELRPFTLPLVIKAAARGHSTPRHRLRLKYAVTPASISLYSLLGGFSFFVPMSIRPEDLSCGRFGCLPPNFFFSSS